MWAKSLLLGHIFCLARAYVEAPILVGGSGESAMRRRKKRLKRLKIETVIRRARRWIRWGNKDGAIVTVLVCTNYSRTEAEKFVDYIEQFTGSVAFLAHNWCDEHRASRFECATKHPQDAHEQEPTAAGDIPTTLSGRKCLCGNAGCCNQWHGLAMWIRDNPHDWSRFLGEPNLMSRSQ